MTFFNNIIAGYGSVLHFIAEFAIHTLELIGIAIIIVGSVVALTRILSHLKNTQSVNVVVGLGKALALALEFKMGAEIVKTVIIRDLKELVILAFVIALRAVLAVLIHWEIKNEEKHEQKKNDE